MVKEIQVSGLQCFEGSRWREAILHFLFGLWSGRKDVFHRPKINFGPVCLRRFGDEYAVYGNPDLEEVPLPKGLRKEEILTADAQSPAGVEVALARFVKDNNVRALIINFPKDPPLNLYKGSKRSELHCFGRMLTMEEFGRREGLIRAA